MKSLNFKDLETRKAVRRIVVTAAQTCAAGAGTGQIGFGFFCLGTIWDAKRTPVPGKWEIFHKGEFFTDMMEGNDEYLQ